MEIGSVTCHICVRREHWLVCINCYSVTGQDMQKHINVTKLDLRLCEPGRHRASSRFQTPNKQRVLQINHIYLLWREGDWKQLPQKLVSFLKTKYFITDPIFSRLILVQRIKKKKTRIYFIILNKITKPDQKYLYNNRKLLFKDITEHNMNL